MAPAPASRPETLAVVLAVKDLRHAKTRLTGADSHPASPPLDRPRLVEAMFADTLAAVVAAGIPRLAVVSPDPRVRARARAAGALIVDEPGTGLNAALTAGSAAAVAAWPVTAVAYLQADLPALTGPVLDAALVAADELRGPGGAAFVADRSGTGTSLLLAAPGFRPAFGVDSATAHRDAGARELDPAGTRWPELRTDVDTAEDLRRAGELALGRHTAAVLCHAEC